MDNEAKISPPADAVKAANPKRFELPEDLDALARMKDQLDIYLKTLESNTESLSDWMNRNKETIILGYYQLHRALRQKDQAAAMTTLQNLGEAAGFVLSIDDFANLSAAAFGDNSGFMTEARKNSEPLPASVLHPLPEVYVPQVELGVSPDVPSAPKLEEPAPRTEASGIWGSVRNLFRHEQIEAEQANRRLEQKMQQWREVRDEMIGLTSDKYYFIDSTMKFIADALDPDPNVRPDDETMLQYRHPQFIIDRAYEDFQQVNREKGSGIRRMAGIYAKIAGAFETQASLDEMKDGIATLSAGEKESQEELMRKMLFRDLDVGSFAEFALKKVKDPQMQISLFAQAVKHEQKIVFKDTEDPKIIFQDLFNSVLEGMDSSVLRIALKPLGIVDHASAIKIYNAYDSVFSYAVDRYINEPDKLQRLLKDMLAYAENESTNINIEGFVQLLTAIRVERLDTNAAILMELLSIHGQTLGVKSLWKLSNRPSLMSIGKDSVNFLHAGLRGGFFDQVNLSATSSAADIDNLLDFINTTFIEKAAHPDLLREFMATAFKNEGTVELRKRLNSGWLEVITGHSRLTDAEKIKMISALLSPFKSDIIRANIMWEASENTTDVKVADKLVIMEQALVGQNIRLGTDRMLINIGKIANIWYTPEKGRECLCYNIDGNAAVMTAKISVTEAKEILSLIARRGPFLQEYNGLFNPKNFDKFIISDKKISYFRNTVSCDLSVSEESGAINKLKGHENYVLLEDNNCASDKKGNSSQKKITGYNLNSVAMILTTGKDTCVLIDKFGEYTHVTGIPKGLNSTQMLEVTEGTYINPDNFSVIGFNKQTNQIAVRIEGKKFLQFIDETGKKDNVYKISVTPERLRALETALSSQVNNDCFYKVEGTLGKTGYSSFFFNFQRLGYIMVGKSGDQHGLFNLGASHSATAGNIRKMEFMPISTPENARKIFDTLSQNSNLILLNNILIHPDFIHEAYFNPRTSGMRILTPSGWLDVEIASYSAETALGKLQNMSGFLSAGEKKNAGGELTVGDVVNMQDVTLIRKDPNHDQTLMTFASELTHTALTHKQADRQFDAFENTDPDTVKAARAELRRKLSETTRAYPVTPLHNASIEKMLSYVALAPTAHSNKKTINKTRPIDTSNNKI
jgi:hypothetical protein